MFKRYVTDADVIQVQPNVETLLNPYRVDSFLDAAYDGMATDLWNYNFNPARVMTELDLNLSETATTFNVPLTESSIASTVTGSARVGNGERRFVVNTTAISGVWTASLQGSNATTEPLTTDSTWRTIATLSLINAVEKSTVIPVPYAYYRCLVSGGTTITYSACMVETLFDGALCYKALELAGNVMIKSQGDIWDTIRLIAQANYNALMQGARFAYDADNSGKITSDELGKKMTTIGLSR